MVIFEVIFDHSGLYWLGGENDVAFLIGFLPSRVWKY
jgi:hypothetical protein